MSDKGEPTTKRVSLTPTAYQQFRDLCRGLDASYSEAFMLLLSLARKPGENALMTGLRLHDELQEGNEKKPQQ